jgi:hypothetical protein
MITSAPASTMTARSRMSSVEEHHPGLFSTALTWVHHAVCGLHGHDPVLQYERDRIFLRCTSCGHETPGWDVSRNPGSVRSMREEERRELHRGLAVARKIA